MKLLLLKLDSICMVSLSRAFKKKKDISEVGLISFLSVIQTLRKLGISPLFLPLSLSLCKSEKVGVGVQASGASCEKWSHLFSLAFLLLL